MDAFLYVSAAFFSILLKAMVDMGIGNLVLITLRVDDNDLTSRRE